MLGLLVFCFHASHVGFSFVATVWHRSRLQTNRRLSIKHQSGLQVTLNTKVTELHFIVNNKNICIIRDLICSVSTCVLWSQWEFPQWDARVSAAINERFKKWNTLLTVTEHGRGLRFSHLYSGSQAPWKHTMYLLNMMTVSTERVGTRSRHTDIARAEVYFLNQRVHN